MRNWAFSRKGGGAAERLVVDSGTTPKVASLADAANAEIAMAGAAAVFDEEVDANAALSSRVLVGFDIVQRFAQHFIDACINAIAGLPPGLMQHADAAGIAVTNKTSAATIAAGSRLTVRVLAISTMGLTLDKYRYSRQVWHGGSSRGTGDSCHSPEAAGPGGPLDACDIAHAAR